jgi:hypothetical protein
MKVFYATLGATLLVALLAGIAYAAHSSAWGAAHKDRPDQWKQLRAEHAVSGRLPDPSRPTG